MMFRSVVLACVVAVLSTPAPADACGPEPGCGDRICAFATAFVDADITAVASDGSTVTLSPQAIFGDAGELTVGVEVTLQTTTTLVPASEVGQRRYVYLQRVDSKLVAATVMDPADPNYAECLGSDATTATIAAQILEPDCNYQLIDHRPPTSCPDTACNAGGPGSTVMVAVLGVFLVAPGRRRVRR